MLYQNKDMQNDFYFTISHSKWQMLKLLHYLYERGKIIKRKKQLLNKIKVKYNKI